LRVQLRFVALLAGVVSLAPLAAHAQEDWSGEVEVRGNYYWERSTLVIAPQATVEVEAPNGVRLHGDYLVDTITSASLGAGAVTDNRFTEIRHDIRLGGGYEFDLGERQLDLTLTGRYGFEPDYTSTGVSLASRLSLNQRATVLALGLTYIHDVIGKKLRGADRSADGRDLSDRGTQGDLDAIVLNAGLEQALSPVLTLAVGYDLGLAYGYQHNPYRTAGVAGTQQDEAHPDERGRHNVHARLAYYIPVTGTALHGIYRAYLDTWDIGALTPEARIYQEIGDLVTLRLRYRYYTQTRAFFQRPDGQYLETDPYRTSDPKMSEFHSNLFGTQVRLDLGFLAGSALDAAAQGSLEITFDFWWNTSASGPGVIAQAAVTMPL
jgi:hypothetical protein